jgi:bifunctional non-homologous end joining protein LigD
VFYRGIGGSGLLRQPSLKGLRPDKSPGDLADSDRAAAAGKTKASKAAKAAKAAKKSSTKKAAHRSTAADPPDEDPGRAEFRLTSPTRIVYPDQGITKRQVADYYSSVMEWFLPEIAGRPVSLLRCTQGVGRPCFFQKHHTAGLENVDAVKLKEEAGNQADYLVVRDAAAVMELVQFNALEFHPWGAHADAPDRADRIVFDLDPGPNVAWADVVDAARKIRGLLEQLGLASFVRTSGGKGLHVVLPLNPGCDWDVVKPFAHGFADAMAQTEPLKFVATATKKFRTGKIFIDYLRNGRGATSVASFSLRARDGAPVAMPLRWDELGRVKSGAAFDIDSAPRRMKRWKAHPWEGIDAIRQDLDQVGDLLGADASAAPKRTRRKR